MIVECPAQALRFAEIAKQLAKLTEREQRGAKIAAKIDGLFQRLAGLRPMVNGGECLLEVADRLAVGGV